MRRSKLRSAAGGIIALSYRLRSWGGITGSSFVLRRPSTLRVGRGDRIRIGSGASIGPGARMVTNGGILDIGADVFISQNATLIAFSNLTIGDRTLIAENVSIHTENHGGVADRMSYTSSPIVIGSDCWIGAGVVITAGCKIGARTTVGANSVVTSDLQPDAVYVGVPAKFLRRSL